MIFKILECEYDKEKKKTVCKRYGFITTNENCSCNTCDLLCNSNDAFYF